MLHSTKKNRIDGLEFCRNEVCIFVSPLLKLALEKTSLRLCTPQMVRNSERARPLEKSKTLVDWVDRIPKNVQIQKQLLKNRLQRENTEIHVHVSG